MASPTKADLAVTVVVPVKNEAANLPACLAALGRFAEVIVVDSASTDDTVAIAQAHGARVVQFCWNGRFPKKRNYILQNEHITQPFVLFLDADEHVSDTFCSAVKTAIMDTDHAGFWLNYNNYFLGKSLNHGVAQKKLALFRVGSGFYERIDEDSWSQLDMEVHEHPQLNGTTGEISVPVDHRDFRGLDRFLARHIDYAKWEAKRSAKLRQKGETATADLTNRQNFKYNNFGKWWFAYSYFLYAYVVKRGFLDGSAGFYYAFYKLWYFQTVRLMLIENTRYSSHSHK